MTRYPIHKQLLQWHHARHAPSAVIINTPQQFESIQQLELLTQTVLIPLESQFGSLHISYGFTSFELLKYIRKYSPGQMAPELDQHAAHELNSRGNRICKRDGASCDIQVDGVSALKLMEYIHQQLPVDRIYFYGEDRALHVSVSPEPKGKIWWVEHGSGKPPRRIHNIDKLIG